MSSDKVLSYKERTPRRNKALSLLQVILHLFIHSTNIIESMQALFQALELW